MSNNTAINHIQRLTTQVVVKCRFEIKCDLCAKPKKGVIARGGALDLGIARQLYEAGWRFPEGSSSLCPKHAEKSDE